MKIYWDYLNHRLLTNTTSAQDFDMFSWVLRDQVPLQVYLVTEDPSTGVFTVGEAPSGYSLKLCLKPTDDRDGAALAFQGTWPLDGSGTGASYSATVDLNTAALIAHLNEAEYVDYVAEFTLQDASGNHRDSTQITCRVTNDIYRGTEVVADIHYPILAEFTHTGKKCIRLSNSDGETLAVFCPPGVTYP